MLQLKKGKEFNVANCTVVIPSISVGNAAQLACDLLIASKKLKRIGTVHHAALIPMFGPAAYQHEPEEKVAACEVYEGAKDHLIVFQMRSPLTSWHAADFHKYLCDLLKGARRVVILSASFGFEKRIIEDTPYQFLASESFKKAHEKELELIEWKEFKGKEINGGGNALKLYHGLEQNVPVMLLFRYLLEGDNCMDAGNMLKELNELCSNFLLLREQNKSIKLTVPSSWDLLFGNDAPELMF